MIFNPCLSIDGLMQRILREYELPHKDLDIAGMLHVLNRFLLRQRRKGLTVVLVIDEAQNLDPQVLEQIRLLSNLETSDEKLIQIILVGQPNMGKLLARPDMRQLNQRISVRYHLRTMDFTDTCGYVRHRLAVADARDNNLFSKMALLFLYLYSKGLPRMINRVCDKAMLIAYSDNHRKVGARTAWKSIKEELRAGKYWTLMTPRRILWASAVLLMALLTPKGISLFTANRLQVQASAGGNLQEEIETGLLTGNLETHAKESEGPGIFQEGPMVEQEPALPALHEEIQPETLVAEEFIPAVGPLKEELSQAGEIETARVGLNTLLQLWNAESLSESAYLGSGTAMVRAIESMGLNLNFFRGPLDYLLRIGSPSLLVIHLPGLKGPRYLALTWVGERMAQVVSPGTREPVLLLKEDLNEFWSGQAYILWRNFDGLPTVSQAGEQGQGIFLLQGLLRAAAVSKREPNGIYDEATMEEVRAFQKGVGIAPDGRVGPHTLALLYWVAGYDIPRLDRKM